MHTTFRLAILVALSLLAATAHSVRAQGATSDLTTAIITFPYVVVDGAQGTDTLISVSNVSNTTIGVQCLLSNRNRRCSTAPLVCDVDADCPFQGTCDPSWALTDFYFTLSPDQPIQWRLGQGATVPVTSAVIPPSPEDPMTGSLQCFAVDTVAQHPVVRNDLLGTATIERYETAPATVLDAAKYNAVGLAAIPAANNGDDTLTLGGPSAEYDPCPNVNVLNHFFEGAVDPVSQKTRIFTTLALVPCSYDRAAPAPGSADVHYLVFNEFEQRFQFAKEFTGQQVSHLGDVNVVFDAGTAGSLAGQTRFRSASAGVMGVAIEEHWTKRNPTLVSTAAMNLFTQGVRSNEDIIGAALCGNGVIDANAGETCDDGNSVSGDGCSAACQIEPCFICAGAPSVCGPPTTCASAAHSTLTLHDVANPRSDNLTWNWTGTAAVADFGSPTDPTAPNGATGYSLCVFDGSALRIQAKVDGGDCGKSACWKNITDGFRYANGRTNQNGVNAVTLKQGTGNAQLIFKAAGTRLSLPGPNSPTQYFTETPSTTAYLVKDDGPECWQAVFTSSTKNTDTVFKATTP